MKKCISFIVTIALVITSVVLFPIDLNAETETEIEIVPYDRLFIGVGDAYTFDIQMDVDYYYITTVNSNIVSVTVSNGVYTIHGVSSGTTSILINYYIDGNFYYKGCTIDVFENYANTYQNAYNTETFYLYVAPRDALLSADISHMTIKNSKWQASNSLYSSWKIISAGNGYYNIYLYDMSSFLCYENEQLILKTVLSAGTEGAQKWRILVNHDGYYVLVPITLEHTNMALATNGVKGTNVYIGDYYSGANAKHWRIIQKTFYLDNYYDNSFDLNQNVIVNSNEFVRDYAFYGTGFSVNFNQSVTYKNDLIADQCWNDIDEPCDDACDESCNNHHKNWNSIMVDVWENIPRQSNHISVLWMDRSPLALCNNHGHVEGYEEEDGFCLGVQLKITDWKDNIEYETHLPVLGILTISNLESISLNSEQIEAIAAIALAHETAHALYMYEAYEIFSNHTPDNCDCIMNKVDFDNIDELYESIINYEIEPFCDACKDHLIEQADTILYVAYGYESINTRESFTGGS